MIERLDITKRVYVKPSRMGEFKAYTLGTADVVLFNPRTMSYDGPRLAGVPLHFINALGFSWPLAEARAGALSVLMPAAVATDVNPARVRDMLMCIDTAPDANAVDACVADLGGISGVRDAIRSRQQLGSELWDLRERVQTQWVKQVVRYSLPVLPPEELAFRAEAKLLDRLGDIQFSDCPSPFSRHVQAQHLRTTFPLIGSTLATTSLLYGDGLPLSKDTGSWKPCSNAATSVVVTRWHAPGSLVYSMCAHCRGKAQPCDESERDESERDSDSGDESQMDMDGLSLGSESDY